jgi:hypothetical protein
MMGNEAHIITGPRKGYPEIRAAQQIIPKLFDMFSYRMGAIQKAIAKREFEKIMRELDMADEETRNQVYTALIEVHNIIKEELKL